MSFEVLPLKRFGPHDVLEAGFARFGRNGTLAVRKEDLQLIGVTDTVVILIDVQTRRIALQKPTPEQASAARRIGYPGKAVGHIVVWAALKALGLKVKTFSPRTVELFVKGPLLIVPLAGEPKTSDRAAADATAPEPARRGVVTTRGAHLAHGGAS